jgi:4-hydroxy-tetrahydrodipicolinate synthase
LVAAVNQGDWDLARQMHRKLFTLCRDLLSLATNPIPIKTAMKILGRDNGQLRLPMTPLTEAQTSRLQMTLLKYGLVDLVA